MFDYDEERLDFYIDNYLETDEETREGLQEYFPDVQEAVYPSIPLRPGITYPVTEAIEKHIADVESQSGVFKSSFKASELEAYMDHSVNYPHILSFMAEIDLIGRVGSRYSMDVDENALRVSESYSDIAFIERMERDIRHIDGMGTRHRLKDGLERIGNYDPAEVFERPEFREGIGYSSTMAFLKRSRIVDEVDGENILTTSPRELELATKIPDVRNDWF